tara:strand:- start:2623 stop:3117 length:495 start_codon:yes stop_codon:yes gene_type:complete
LIQITPVIKSNEIEQVALLAEKIWTEHFTPIIGKPQVEYMLDKFQSTSSITTQLSEGYEYYLISSAGEFVGYTGLKNEADRLMISKLYALDSARGTGIGKKLLEFIESKAFSCQANVIWLTVNKNNTEVISWYKRRGFSIVDSVKADIGDGYFMDDYIMEKAVL